MELALFGTQIRKIRKVRDRLARRAPQYFGVPCVLGVLCSIDAGISGTPRKSGGVLGVLFNVYAGFLTDTQYESHLTNHRAALTVHNFSCPPRRYNGSTKGSHREIAALGNAEFLAGRKRAAIPLLCGKTALIPQ